MSNWYIGGGSEYEIGDKAQVWFNVDINGHVTGIHDDYGTGDIEVSDPYLWMGNIGTVASPDPKAYFGLSGHYHLRIDENGISGFHQGEGSWKNIFDKATAGELNHNDLANINAEDNYEHITQTQKDALHTKYTDSEARASINNIFGSDGHADSDIDMDQHKIIDLPAPSAVNDAARKTYVDGKISDADWDSNWNGVGTIAPSKNAVYDVLISMLGGGGNMCRIKSGTYTGNATANRLINTTIKPKFVRISCWDYQYGAVVFDTMLDDYCEYLSISTDDYHNGYANMAEIVGGENGFRVGDSSMNTDTYIYYWVAMG